MNNFTYVYLKVFDLKYILSKVNGEWISTSNQKFIPDPLNGSNIIEIPDVKAEDINVFIKSLMSCPKSGLHNPYKVYIYIYILFSSH